MSEEWWQALLGGSLGVAATVLLALYLVHRELRNARDLAREERRYAACIALHREVYDMKRMTAGLYAFVDQESSELDTPRAWEAVMDIFHRAEYALPLALAAGNELQAPYMNALDRVNNLQDVFVEGATTQKFYDRLEATLDMLDKLRTAIRHYLTRAVGLADNPELDLYV